MANDKYFKPADFSDFECFNEVLEDKVGSTLALLPDKIQLTNIASRINKELQACETGTSKLTNRIVQVSSTAATKQLFSVLINDFNNNAIVNFLEAVKQDYGLIVATWMANEVLGPFAPIATQTAGNWRKNDQTT